MRPRLPRLSSTRSESSLSRTEPGSSGDGGLITPPSTSSSCLMCHLTYIIITIIIIIKCYYYDNTGFSGTGWLGSIVTLSPVTEVKIARLSAASWSICSW